MRVFFCPPDMTMRNIAPGEVCLTAEEIVARFAGKTGHVLHPTNAGNAAKSLELDYIEGPIDPVWKKGRKSYAELDLPLIFEQLQALADRRAKYG